jgi:hypothetical protein
MPPLDARKRQRGTGHAKVAGWLVGRADAGSALGVRRGSGHVRAGGRGLSRSSDSLSHRGHYGSPMLRGGWRYGGRRRW